MLRRTIDLLNEAQKEQYAVGAFNIYNLEGLMAVINAAEVLSSPVIVQLHPIAISWNNGHMIKVCEVVAAAAKVPVGVHLDHCQNKTAIKNAIVGGIGSVMADGSELTLPDNTHFTRSIVKLAKHYGASVEGELGKLAGEEDGLAVEEYEAKLTDPQEAEHFVRETGIHSLAVCIGNVHGKYVKPPNLDMTRLQDIRERVNIPLVLHGASGLPSEMVKEAIARGICKFNVNTEVRKAYLSTVDQVLRDDTKPELVPIITRSVTAMAEVVKRKLTLFGSVGKG